MKKISFPQNPVLQKVGLIICILHVAVLSLKAQPDTLRIWPEEIPGRVKTESYSTEQLLLSGWTRVVHISDPSLIVYPADPAFRNGTAVVICPGGGYEGVAIGHEGEEIARWFNRLGITALVLKYRLPHNNIMKDKTIGPLMDAQEALRIVRRNAVVWGVDQHKIGIMGFSAGGHLAATLSTQAQKVFYSSKDQISARPDFSILIYPVISMRIPITHRGSRNNLLGLNPSDALIHQFSAEEQVTPDTPPAFLVHSFDDNTVPVHNSLLYFSALQHLGIPSELHIYHGGGHGYGLGRTPHSESFWADACEKWLKTRGLLD